MVIPSPPDIESLVEAAKALGGQSVEALATRLEVEVPEDLRAHKGWLGELIERALGATAGSRPTVDFPALGVELKTLPIDRWGKPLESTWVCAAPIDGTLADRWEDSRVRDKLSCVLWVPVLSERSLPLAQRRLALPLLWQMDIETEQTLASDWRELTDLIRLGRFDEIHARRGTWLQLRPKAADSRVTRWALDDESNWVPVNPKGFYLRARFTEQLLKRHWALPTRGSS